MAYNKYREATTYDSSSMDDTDHGIVHDGIYIGSGGDLKAVFAKDTVAVIMKNIPDGTLLPFELKQIESSATTADDIILIESGMKGSG